ncbi:hypothetical protein [Devosia sp. LjRoot3]|uniref:hypothetical protein n=1 Tax=Devosia sp. LjRoot3 TaxID=3342319 RepID=UPI003ED01627
MAQKSTLAAFRVHTRLILAIMVAVLVSMTFHHGAMASVTMTHGHVENHHQSGQPCEVGCQPSSHSMPVCCAMGLCVSGITGAPMNSLFPKATTDQVGLLTSFVSRWVAHRIDRPPKEMVRA